LPRILLLQLYQLIVKDRIRFCRSSQRRRIHYALSFRKGPEIQQIQIDIDACFAEPVDGLDDGWRGDKDDHQSLHNLHNLCRNSGDRLHARRTGAQHAKENTGCQHPSGMAFAQQGQRDGIKAIARLKAQGNVVRDAQSLCHPAQPSQAATEEHGQHIVPGHTHAAIARSIRVGPHST